jgi:L,D-transpeptidase ErfK/SrfK
LAALGAAGAGAPALASEEGRPQVIGELARRTIQWGETLHDIARAANVGFVELRAANPGVSSWEPPAGLDLLIPSAHLLPYDAGDRIVVNVGDMRLYYYEPDGRIRSYPIGVGREAHQTPQGVLKVTELREKPIWYPTPGQRADDPTLPEAVPQGPDNPLGEYALRIGWDGYNIHGTNFPDSIGRRLTRGCVRLYPWDIEELFGLVKVGDTVRITDEPAKLGWIDGELYLEVHPFGPDADAIELGRPFEAEPLPYLDAHVAYAAGAQIHRVDWTRVRKLEKERSGVPGQITV